MYSKKDTAISREILNNACLVTDFYQFTMAQAYFSHQRQNTHAVFHLFFRKNPFKGNWTLAAGIHDAISFIKHYKIDDDSLSYLSSLKTSTGAAYFSDSFLSFLSKTEPTVTVHGVHDGDVVFPFEPLLRVEGPLFLCQLLETPILNIVNFQTLIATKAARIALAAQGKPVIDFGLRRAQGFDGAMAASKAAFIGGSHATSNVHASKSFQIPLSGTHSHSFVMSYQRQIDAFNDFAHTFSDQCVLVVDTGDPIVGINDAIQVFLSLLKRGHHPIGLRLDSGNIHELSMYARAALNRAGLSQCSIIASGDLDEYEIARLEALKAPIDIYGVGTKLVTAYDDPALSGVFKLASIEENGVLRHTHKSSGGGKKSLPGPQTIVRRFQDTTMVADRIIDPELLKNSFDERHEKELHFLLMDKGHLTYEAPDLNTVRKKAIESIKSLPNMLKEKTSQPPYPVYFDGMLLTNDSLERKL